MIQHLAAWGVYGLAVGAAFTACWIRLGLHVPRRRDDDEQLRWPRLGPRMQKGGAEAPPSRIAEGAGNTRGALTTNRDGTTAHG